GITHLHWSSDGKRLVTSGPCGRVCLWDGTTGELLRAFVHPKRNVTCDLSGDGTLVVGAGEGTVVVWETATGKVRHTWEGKPGDLTHALFVRNGKALAVYDSQGGLLVDAATGQALDKFAGQQ